MDNTYLADDNEMNQTTLKEIEHKSTDTIPVSERTPDIKSIYMREMSAFSLLDQEGEIEIFMRIENAMNEICTEIGKCPPAIGLLISIYEKHKAGEIKEKIATGFWRSVRRFRKES